MSEVMASLNLEFQKQAKIAAKKQLYFALASMVSSQMIQLKKMHMASAHLRDSCEGEVSREMLEAILTEEMAHLGIIYQTAVSIKNYAAAFGEAPEFTRFLEKQMPDGVSIDKWIECTDDLFRKCSKTLGANDKGETLINGAVFGKVFFEHCEAIKIKGE